LRNRIRRFLESIESIYGIVDDSESDICR